MRAAGLEPGRLPGRGRIADEGPAGGRTQARRHLPRGTLRGGGPAAVRGRCGECDGAAGGREGATGQRDREGRTAPEGGPPGAVAASCQGRPVPWFILRSAGCQAASLVLHAYFYRRRTGCLDRPQDGRMQWLRLHSDGSTPAIGPGGDDTRPKVVHGSGLAMRPQHPERCYPLPHRLPPGSLPPGPGSWSGS